MARSDSHFARDSAVSIAKNLKIGDIDPYSPPEKPSSVHSETSSSKSRLGSLRNDIIHPKDSLLSLDASEKSSLSKNRLAGMHSVSASSGRSNNLQSPKVKGAAKSKFHMPLLRKTSQEVSPTTSIDLSRSSFEQDGLGIYTSYEREGRQSDSLTRSAGRRIVSGLHNRSTSGNSQLSTGSSSTTSKPGSQYVHPMRQTPRAYTPPLSQSYQTSIIESEDSGNGDSTEGDLLAQSGADQLYSSVRTSGQAQRLSLQTHDSFTRLPSMSQTNITPVGRSSFGYSRENSSALDTTSPASRSSLDFVFRSKTRTSMDPISRAATVQAARQAFEEKEAAKARKLEEQQVKAEEKQMKRKDKQHWRTSLRVEHPQEPLQDKGISEKPITSPGPSPLPISEPGTNSGSWKSQSKSAWVLFLTWLRTRIFKLRRKVRKLS